MKAPTLSRDQRERCFFLPTKPQTIDAGGLPMHWLTDVVPAQSVALLTTFVPQHELDSNGALNAIATHADPSADPVLDRYLAPNQPEWVRKRVASLEASQRGAHGVEAVKS